MNILIDRNIYRYLLCVFTLYCGIYLIILNVENDSTIWDLVYYINENVLLLNVLYALSRIIQDVHLRAFAYILIRFKALIAILNILAIAKICEIQGVYVQAIVIIYWVVSLITYIYVSHKRLRK